MKSTLSALVVLLTASWTGMAAAQETVITVDPLPEPPLVREVTGLAPAAAPGALADPAGPARRTPVRTFLNRHGLGCNAHHSWFGCGNLRSELTFIFGSCRTFYGEPCFPKAPIGSRGGFSGMSPSQIAPPGVGPGGPGQYGPLVRDRGCATCK